MTITQEAISKTQVKLTIELMPEEVRPHTQRAAAHISEHIEISGFRKGKATHDAVVRQVGEMRVLEEAVDDMVRTTLLEAVRQEGLDTSGQPNVEVQKMVPGSVFVYEATLTLMPTVKKLARYDKLSVEAKPIVAKEEDIAKALKDLTRMQTKETRALTGHVVGDNDLAVIDLNMTRDRVPLEGGTGKGARVYMNEDFYLPEMREALRGMKEGDAKSFPVTFPAEHYQKHLAGQQVLCDVTVTEVYTLQPPALDDAFAKTLGLESVAALRAKIAENIEEENRQEETTRQERELMELLATKSTFTDIPDSMMEGELDRMMQELEVAVERQGGVFADYLQSLKKTAEELRDGMRDAGLMRVKVGVILREVARREGIEVDDDAVHDEVEKQVTYYKDSPERLKYVRSPMYAEFMRHRLRNERVVKFLREMMVNGVRS